MTSKDSKIKIILLFFFFQLFQLYHATLTNKGFTIDLIYRDSENSPLYPGNLTITEKVRRMVQFSEAHNVELEASISNTHYHMNMNLHPTLQKEGYIYLVKLKISHTDLNLILDTGSQLPWTQVEPCHPCFAQDGAKFNLSASHSFQYLSTTSRFCDIPMNGKCMLHLRYSSGVETKGIIGSDYFKLGGESNDVRVIFGCANQTTPGMFGSSKVGGVIGMNKGPLSFPMQLSQHTSFPSRFSYCFGRSTMEPSYLRFGSDIRLKPEESQATPLVETNSGQYYVNLIDISLNGQRLKLPSKTFTRKRDGMGGCIFDSGTPVSRIIRPAYDILTNKLKSYFENFPGLRKIRRENLDLCYEWSNHTGFPVLPKLDLHFEGAVLNLKPHNTFISMGSNKFCLMMVPSNSMTIVGSIMQMRNQVVYDIAGRRIYFKYTENCTQNRA